MFFSKTTVAACGFAALSSAHMLMNTPPRFTSPQAQLGPLSPDGSNYPCQQVAGASYAGPVTEMALGSSQPLAFTGEAVHGGGSCQVSLSTDTAPTKNSVFKVIHSIQGGCPAVDTTGNLGSDASQADPFTYKFPIPTDIPTGNYTLAWSWLNRIGNREFYMNCAAVSLTGTSGSQANFDKLPNMVIANIVPNAGCTTKETFNYVYADPGDSVENLGSSDQQYMTLDGSCGNYVSTTLPQGTGGAGAASPAASSSTSSSLPGGVFVTVPTDGATTTVAATATATTLTTVTSSGSPAAAQPTSGSTGGSGSSGSTSTNGSSTGGSSTSAGVQTPGSACTPEGTWNCIGGTSFQQCGSGQWSVVQQLAAGTSCTTGMGSTINIVATNRKRRVGVRFSG